MDEIKLLKIKEGETWLKVPDLNVYKKPEYAPVFYNPEMAFDRNVSVEFLRIVKPKKVLDLLCGIGARGIRYAKEVGVNVICNDACEKAIEIAKENAGINGVEVEFSNEEANRFLLKNMEKFEYIDIDPFGSPVYFLNNSFLRIIPKGGYLMCTATDTGTLCGKFAKRTFKRYFVKSGKNSAEHEIGVRTLIGCIVRFGLMYDISVKVQYAYARKHYYRVCVKTMGSKDLEKNMEKIGFYKGIGPIWLGELGEKEIIEKLGEDKIFKYLKEECEFEKPYVDIRKEFPKNPVKIEKVVETLKEQGYKASRTHFCPTGIKTDASFEDLKKILEDLSEKGT